MKYEKTEKIPGGMWKDGVIATRPLDLRPGDDGDSHHRGKEFSAERAAICETCTRPSDQCNGVCVRVVPDKHHRKRKKVAG